MKLMLTTFHQQFLQGREYLLEVVSSQDQCQVIFMGIRMGTTAVMLVVMLEVIREQA